jgi:chaperonin cofactor prefoldin
MLEQKEILHEIAKQKKDIAIIKLKNDIEHIDKSIELLRKQKAKITTALKKISNINDYQLDVFTGTSEDIIAKLLREAYEE